MTKLHGLGRRAGTPGGLGKAGNGSRVAGSGGSRPDRARDATSDEHQAPWVSGSHGRAPAGESTGEVRGEGDGQGKEAAARVSVAGAVARGSGLLNFYPTLFFWNNNIVYHCLLWNMMGPFLEEDIENSR